MLRLSLLDAAVVEPALLLLLAVGAVLVGAVDVGDAALLDAACSADALPEPAALLAPFLTPSLHQQLVLQLGTPPTRGIPGQSPTYQCEASDL